VGRRMVGDPLDRRVYGAPFDPSCHPEGVRIAPQDRPATACIYVGTVSGGEVHAK